MEVEDDNNTMDDIETKMDDIDTQMNSMKLIESESDNINEEHIDNNQMINNIINTMDIMNISNDDTFGSVEWWINGIPNVNCKIVDDEDFVYSHLTLPNSIFQELTESGMLSYAEYFEAFCCNNEEMCVDECMKF